MSPMIKPSFISIKLKPIGNGQAELTYSENLSHAPKPIRELTAKLTAHHLKAQGVDYKWDGETFSFTVVEAEEKAALRILQEIVGFIKPQKAKAFIDWLEGKGFIPFTDIADAKRIVAESSMTIGQLQTALAKAGSETSGEKWAIDILNLAERLGLISTEEKLSAMFEEDGRQ